MIIALPGIVRVTFQQSHIVNSHRHSICSPHTWTDHGRAMLYPEATFFVFLSVGEKNSPHSIKNGVRELYTLLRELYTLLIVSCDWSQEVTQPMLLQNPLSTGNSSYRFPSSANNTPQFNGLYHTALFSQWTSCVT